MKPQPFRIAPFFSPRLWGVRSLTPIFPAKSQLQEPIGEAWLTGVDCKISTGEFSGKTLAQAWKEMPAEWRGAAFSAQPDAPFPLLLKFLFPNEKLSIQVHPNDDYASQFEREAGGRGKTEMWHAISAQPGAELLLGLRPGTTKEAFAAAIDDLSLEKLFVVRPVQQKDTFFVPAGSAHTLGANMIIFECQQYSDLTYRVYDYGRLGPDGKPRELHIAKALEVTNFANCLAGPAPPLRLPAQNFERSLLAACSYFATERLEISGPAFLDLDHLHFDLFAVASGSGTLDGQNFSAPYSSGDCWFFPASMNRYHLLPSSPTTLLRSYVPDLAALRAELLRAGHSDSALNGTVFK